MAQDLGGCRSIHHRRIVQRRSALIGFGVGISSRLEQHLSRRRSILRRRNVQRRTAVIVFVVGIGSRLEQNLRSC